MSEVDRYYTPAKLALQLVEDLQGEGVRRILDSACGNGRLLSAAEQVYPSARCIGIDQDQATIKTLRRLKPEWTLIAGNALEHGTWRRRIARAPIVPADAVLLNPPFSMGPSKSLNVVAWDLSIECSLAMAHVLFSLEQSFARVGVAIVPESWAYAERDDAAHKVLRSRYHVTLLRGVKNSTFRGARANGIVARFVRGASRSKSFQGDAAKDLSQDAAHILRGGLPVFERVRWSNGIPYIHSTAIGILSKGQCISSLEKVRQISRGVVSGHVVLVPRVGLPKLQFLRSLFLPTPCQLSDCVIAFRSNSAKEMRRVEAVLRTNFSALKAQYHGTGARYVTVRRLTNLAKSLGLERNDAPPVPRIN